MARPNGIKIGDKCSKCGDVITTENLVYTSRYNIKAECKKCRNLYNREWRKANPEAHVEYDIRQYGISLADYKKRVEIQLGGCAICKQPCSTGQRLAVDHDHKTNIIRDLLCRRCNTVLGLVNDDELLLFDILDYLKRHDVQKVV